MEPTDWAPEHSGALRELFAQHLSFGRITEAINRKFNTNYSRSAVLGRARRMGLAGSKQSVLPSWEQQPQLNRPREAHLVDPPALRVRWPVPPPMEMEPVKLRCVELEPRHLSLIELERGDCRYPYGGDEEGEPITFCGHPCRLGSSYCTPHFHLSRGSGTHLGSPAGAAVLRLVETA